MTPTLAPESRDLVTSIAQALREQRIDDAQAGWERLQEAGPLPEEAKAFPVYVMLGKGQTMDALQYMNGMPDDFCPEARALCLYLAGDPTWQGHARALEESTDPLVREGARHLLETAANSR